MTEAAPEHTDSKHSLDELFQLLVHARGVLPDTTAKEEILSALQRGDLQVDHHIRGGARSVRLIREPSPEKLRELEALSAALQEREASKEEMREAMDRATAVLYEHAPPEGLTRRVHRESWEPGRVFSLTIKDDCLNVLPNCSLDYPWDAYSFTIANWSLVNELWPPRQEPSSSKPGSADVWINDLHPNDWHRWTAKKIWQEATSRGCTLSLRAFQRTLAKRRLRR